MFDDDEVWRGFASDGGEALLGIEQSLLDLEGDPTGDEHVHRLYRGLHTLKGNSGFLRLVHIERLAHAAEDLVGLVRDAGVPFDAEMVETMLAVVDRLKAAVDEVARTRSDVADTSELVATVAALHAQRDPARAPSAERGSAAGAASPNVAWPSVAPPSAARASVVPIDPVDDPEYVSIFLQMARELLGRLGEAILELPQATAQGRARAVEACDELSLAAERMGLVAVVDAARALVRALDSGNVDVHLLELEIYGQVVRVEEHYRSLVGAGEDFGLAEVYRRGCANVAIADLAHLRHVLEDGGALAAPPDVVVALLRRLQLACGYYGLPEACARWIDGIGRHATIDEGGKAWAATALAFIDQLTAAIHAVNAGRDDTPVVEPPDDPMKFDPDDAELPVSPYLRRQLTRTALHAVGELAAAGLAPVEVAADLERDEAASVAFQEWLSSSGARFISSAVTDEVPPTYRFLLGVAGHAADVNAAWAATPCRGRVRAHDLTPGGRTLDEGRAPPAAARSPAPPGGLAPSRRDDADDEPGREPRAEDDRRVEFLRIDARKVSLILDLAGELGLAVGAVTQHPELAGLELEGYSAAAHKLEVLVRELQNEVSSMRLVPVAGVFQRMKRVVRDTARRTGKNVRLELEGEETEIDKVMVDSLQEPLVHLLRNAIDHGLESTAERVAAGKSEVGRVVLSASHQGGEVSIEVSDDGKGLDRERILARAIERQLVPAGAQLSPDEIDRLIFLPGFSTKETVSELSGRGVGMDAVKAAAEAIRGHVNVTSTPGRGTRIRMSLPLTLAFVEAMVVREDDRLFAVPIERVREVFQVDPKNVFSSSVDGRTLLRVRDALVPILWLHDYYQEHRGRAGELEGRVVVVVQARDGAVALPVDGLLGNQQVMLKPLSGVLAKVRAAAGCGVLRSGDVALALDCESLHA